MRDERLEKKKKCSPVVMCRFCDDNEVVLHKNRCRKCYLKDLKDRNEKDKKKA